MTKFQTGYELEYNYITDYEEHYSESKQMILTKRLSFERKHRSFRGSLCKFVSSNDKCEYMAGQERKTSITTFDTQLKKWFVDKKWVYLPDGDKGRRTSLIETEESLKLGNGCSIIDLHENFKQILTDGKTLESKVFNSDTEKEELTRKLNYYYRTYDIETYYDATDRKSPNVSEIQFPIKVKKKLDKIRSYFASMDRGTYDFADKDTIGKHFERLKQLAYELIKKQMNMKNFLISKKVHKVKNSNDVKVNDCNIKNTNIRNSRAPDSPKIRKYRRSYRKLIDECKAKQLDEKSLRFQKKQILTNLKKEEALNKKYAKSVNFEKKNISFLDCNIEKKRSRKKYMDDRFQILKNGTLTTFYELQNHKQRIQDNEKKFKTQYLDKFEKILKKFEKKSISMDKKRSDLESQRRGFEVKCNEELNKMKRAIETQKIEIEKQNKAILYLENNLNVGQGGSQKKKRYRIVSSGSKN